jgi:acyl dehydratase
MGKYFEEFVVGETLETRGRTVAESDIIAFAGLSGDNTPIHLDAEFAKTGPFGERIAHGPLPMSMAIGLMTHLGLFDGTVVALLNLNWDFKGVVKIGDTIRARVRAEEKRLTSRPDRGVVKVRIDVVNQRGEVVQSGVNTVLVACRPA